MPPVLAWTVRFMVRLAPRATATPTTMTRTTITNTMRRVPLRRCGGGGGRCRGDGGTAARTELRPGRHFGVARRAVDGDGAEGLAAVGAELGADRVVRLAVLARDGGRGERRAARGAELGARRVGGGAARALAAARGQRAGASRGRATAHETRSPTGKPRSGRRRRSRRGWR